MIRTAAIGLAVFALAAMSARAQVCETSCSMYNQGQCVEYTQHCTTPPPPPPAYGAIAYGRSSGAWGASDHWADRAKAESAALARCGEHGSDCEVIVWFKNQCAAVAAAGPATAYWGLGDGLGAARGNALSNCSKQGGTNCRVQADQCSR